MELNTRVEQIMEYAELTPSEFANKIGVNPSNISQIINRRNKPSLDLITKIKNQFPELQWEWIIEGKGSMTNDSPSPTTLPNLVESKFNFDEDFAPIPDLFNSEISNDDKGTIIEKEILKESILPKEENSNWRESNISAQHTEEEKIYDSQRLENKNFSNSHQYTDNQINRIKKIVFFYENGKFEVFEP